MSKLYLISNWFIKPGYEQVASAELSRLAQRVQEGEPGTLAYLIHTPHPDNQNLTTLPPTTPGSVLFYEIYRDTQAFLDHLHGPIFTEFVQNFGQLFVNANGKPYTTVIFLEMFAGFTRPEILVSNEASNLHPGVMVEIIAVNQDRLKQFYASVFGWDYQIGSGGFAYVHFGLQTTALLGGIGQADNNQPGFQPGHNFYLKVNNLPAVIENAIANGGQPLMGVAEVDGYRFAMIKDPEGNPLGLIEPFEY